MNIQSNLLNKDTVFEVFQHLSRKPTPSGTVTYSAVPGIRKAMDLLGIPQHLLEPDYLGTGNPVLLLHPEPTTWVGAHSDQISYDISMNVQQLPWPGNEQNPPWRHNEGTELFQRRLLSQFSPDSWVLSPNCAHRASGDYPGLALRFDLHQQMLVPTAKGLLRAPVFDSAPVVFVVKEGCVRPGETVVYDVDPVRDGDLVQDAQVDNKAGMVACLLAAACLLNESPCPRVAIAFCDWEEGPPFENGSFARGARILSHHLHPGSLWVNVDGHDISPTCQLGGGAVFAKTSTGGRGAITPPHIFAELQHESERMIAHGIKFTQSLKSPSRSDDAGVMGRLHKIILAGYPVRHPHFGCTPGQLPTAHLQDLVDLCHAICRIYNIGHPQPFRTLTWEASRPATTNSESTSPESIIPGEDHWFPTPTAHAPQPSPMAEQLVNEQYELGPHPSYQQQQSPPMTSELCLQQQLHGG